MPTPITTPKASHRPIVGVEVSSVASATMPAVNSSGPPMSKGRNPMRLANLPAGPDTIATTTGARADARPA